MELCFHVYDEQGDVRSKSFFITNTMTSKTNASWLELEKTIKEGDDITPKITYDEFFNANFSVNVTKSLTGQFTSYGLDNTTNSTSGGGPYRKWCIQSGEFGGFFPAVIKNGTNYTVEMNLVMDGLRNNGSCKHQQPIDPDGYDQILFCDLATKCTHAAPTLRIYVPPSDNSTQTSSLLMWWLIAGVGLILIILIAIVALKEQGKENESSYLSSSEGKPEEGLIGDEEEYGEYGDSGNRNTNGIDGYGGEEGN
jgi:hypothetical protein